MPCRRLALLPVIVLLLSACGGRDRLRGFQQVGLADIYPEAEHGQPVTSGEALRPDALTAAHASLPIDSVVRVTNTTNDRATTVRVNDRLPPDAEVIIRLTPRTAGKLGFTHTGLARVRVESFE